MVLNLYVEFFFGRLVVENDIRFPNRNYFSTGIKFKIACE